MERREMRGWRGLSGGDGEGRRGAGERGERMRRRRKGGRRDACEGAITAAGGCGSEGWEKEGWRERRGGARSSWEPEIKREEKGAQLGAREGVRQTDGWMDEGVDRWMDGWMGDEQSGERRQQGCVGERAGVPRSTACPHGGGGGGARARFGVQGYGKAGRGARSCGDGDGCVWGLLVSGRAQEAPPRVHQGVRYVGRVGSRAGWLTHTGGVTVPGGCECARRPSAPS